EAAGSLLTIKGLQHVSRPMGPSEAEACGVLKISLSAIVSNWDRLAKNTEAECAAVVKGNAYGCGIEPIAGALAKTGCRTFCLKYSGGQTRSRGRAKLDHLCCEWAVLWNRTSLHRNQCATRHPQFYRIGRMERLCHVASMGGRLRATRRYWRE